MVLGGEVLRLARDPGQQRQVVTEQRLSCRRGDPIRPLVSQIKAGVRVVDKVRAVARLLQGVPIDRQILAAMLEPVAQLPEAVVLPGRVGGKAPGAECPPVVRGVSGLHWLHLVQPRVSHRVGVIPTLPRVALAELLRLPPQIAFFPITDLVGRIA